MSRQARFEAEERERRDRYEKDRSLKEKSYRTNLALGITNLGLSAARTYQGFKEGSAKIRESTARAKDIEMSNEARERESAQLGQSYTFEQAFGQARREAGEEYFDNKLRQFVATRYGTKISGTDEVTFTQKSLNRMDTDLKNNPDLVADIELHKIMRSQTDMATYGAILKDPEKFRRPGPDGSQPDMGEDLQKAKALYADAKKRFNRGMIKVKSRDPKLAKQIWKGVVRNNVNQFKMDEKQLDSFIGNMVKSGMADTGHISQIKQAYYEIQAEGRKAEADSAAQNARVKTEIYNASKIESKGAAIPTKEEMAGRPLPERMALTYGTKTKAPKPPRIIKGADGYNYNADTGERILPDVKKPPEKAPKPPYEKGKRYKTTGPDGSPQEGTFRGMGKDGEPQWSNVTPLKEKKGKGAASDRRQYRKKSTETFDYLMGLEDEISETGKKESSARRKRFYSLFLSKREKYRKAGEDAETGAMLAVQEIMAELPEEEKSKSWVDSLLEKLSVEDVASGVSAAIGLPGVGRLSEPAATATNAKQEAKDYGVSESPEGTTMDNPNTGETIVSRNGRWVRE